MPTYFIMANDVHTFQPVQQDCTVRDVTRPVATVGTQRRVVTRPASADRDVLTDTLGPSVCMVSVLIPNFLQTGYFLILMLMSAIKKSEKCSSFSSHMFYRLSLIIMISSISAFDDP